MTRSGAPRRMLPGLIFGLAVLLTGCASTPRPAAPPRPGTAPLVAPLAGEKTFLGMTEAGLRQRLGTPVFVRKEGSTQMWRYDGAACRAFFFLSITGAITGATTGATTGAAPVLAVRYVETLPRKGGQGADPACLAALSASPPKTS